MKIVSWNVWGVGSARKRGVIKDYLIKYSDFTRDKMEDMG